MNESREGKFRSRKGKVVPRREAEMMQRALGPTVKGLAGTDEKLAKHQIKFKVIISFKCVRGN